MTIDKKCLINWVGGKRLLRKTIEKLIPKDIGSYIEPFGGGGWVLFYKDKWADLEVYNDLDGRLVNLFRIVKYHPKAFIEEWGNLLGSREMFLQFLNAAPITDIQKAVQFYYLITRSFGGRGDTFGKDKGELAAVIAHQIGKISNNMPSVSREQAKTNAIHLTDKKGKEIMSFESKHILSHEKLNKDKVDLVADRTAVDFMIQNGSNPLALLSVYGRYYDYDEDGATVHIMNVYDYINYNFPDKLKQGYPTDTYKKALLVIQEQLKSRTLTDNERVRAEQAKINEKKLKQANSAFKGLNPWNSSYTTLLLHK